MRLYFACPGESEAGVLRMIANRGYRHGLTPQGREQAAALAQTLAPGPEGGSVRQVFTSPLLRAMETAQVLGSALHASITMTDALREFDCGIAEGRCDDEAWEMRRRVREDWYLRGRWESRVEGGESLLDVRERFVPFLRRVTQAREGAHSLVLVGHAGLYGAVLPLVLANVTPAFAEGHPFPAAGFAVAEAGAGGLRCVEWCRLRLE